jgi:NlpC/P60 family protein
MGRVTRSAARRAGGWESAGTRERRVEPQPREVALHDTRSGEAPLRRGFALLGSLNERCPLEDERVPRMSARCAARARACTACDHRRGWAQTAFAAVHPPSEGSQRGRAPRLQKLPRAYARHQVGVGYSWGGTSPRTSFDCSGLVYAAYRSIGWKLPRSSWDQLRVGRPVRLARLRPGDLLFTEGGGHVQLVVSRSAAISAPQTGERVRYVPLAQLRPAFAGARRVLK